MNRCLVSDCFNGPNKWKSHDNKLEVNVLVLLKEYEQLGLESFLLHDSENHRAGRSHRLSFRRRLYLMRTR